MCIRDRHDMAEFDDSFLANLPADMHDVRRWLLRHAFDVLNEESMSSFTELCYDHQFPPEEVYLRICRSGHITMCLHFDTLSEYSTNSDEDGEESTDDSEDDHAFLPFI
eukprot:TRINITY_DN16050_c0_g1_i2.p1 TRINITY_DN16050_c0_g1~~TRINITY_DN16050_c0_g1_i2.p1  ORF type:complete len:109 (-),score=23.44 TRINITY_DN16050_c0_g1_i2:369-695(-)